MKIKKFNNKWTMGLIILATILLIYYILSFISPKFLVGIAEIPAIIKFGEFIDRYKFTYYLFTFITSFIVIYVFVCACCRTNKLKLRDCLIIIMQIIFMFLVGEYSIEYYTLIDALCMAIVPTIICALNKETNINKLYSTIICLGVHYFTQIIFVKIRDLFAYITFPNSATFTILLIDSYIWLFVLYSIFNYKEVINNG